MKKQAPTRLICIADKLHAYDTEQTFPFATLSSTTFGVLVLLRADKNKTGKVKCKCKNIETRFISNGNISKLGTKIVRERKSTFRLVTVRIFQNIEALHLICYFIVTINI